MQMIRLFLIFILTIELVKPMPIDEQSFFDSNQDSLGGIYINQEPSTTMLAVVLKNQPDNAKLAETKAEENGPFAFSRLEVLLICLGVCLLCLLICYKINKFIKRHYSQKDSRPNKNFNQLQMTVSPRTSTRNFDRNLSQQDYDYIETIRF